jgi:hypothetical protein
VSISFDATDLGSNLGFDPWVGDEDLTGTASAASLIRARSARSTRDTPSLCRASPKTRLPALSLSAGSRLFLTPLNSLTNGRARFSTPRLTLQRL